MVASQTLMTGVVQPLSRLSVPVGSGTTPTVGDLPCCGLYVNDVVALVQSFLAGATRVEIGRNHLCLCVASGDFIWWWRSRLPQQQPCISQSWVVKTAYRS